MKRNKQPVDPEGSFAGEVPWDNAQERNTQDRRRPGSRPDSSVQSRPPPQSRITASGRHQRPGRPGMHEEDTGAAPPPTMRPRGGASTTASRQEQTSMSHPSRIDSGIPSATMSSRTGHNQVTYPGAVAVPGIDGSTSGTISGDVSVLTTETRPETVVAEAVTRDAFASEIREQLRSEIREELQAQLRNNIVTAEAVSAEGGSSSPPMGSSEGEAESPGRKRWLIAALVLLAVIIGGVVGALFATGTIGGDGGAEADKATTGNPQGGAGAGGVSTPGPSLHPTSAPPSSPPSMSSPPPVAPTAPAPTPSPPSTTSPPTAAPTVPPGTTVSFAQEIQGRDNGDRFGDFVQLSRDGSTMAVGSTDGDYVRVYRRSGTQWAQIGQTISGDGGQFGRCVDLNLDGSVLAVGAWGNDDAAENAGQAKVYRFSGSEWIKVGQTLLGSEAGDRFGWYVALSDDGRTVAVSGRLGDPSGDRIDAGYVRVYTNGGGNLRQSSDDWIRLGNSDLEGEAAEDQFGRSLAFDADGRRLVVGAVQGAGGNGRIRVFDFSGGDWNFVGQALDGEDDQDWQGTSVALSQDGAVLAVGADGTDTNGSNAGAVLVFTLDGSTWTRRGQVILGEGSDDQFGAGHISLSSDGNCLAVGANHNSNDLGKGYLFQWTGSQWNEIASVSGDSTGDRLGDSATISGDCTWLAFGAPEFDTSGSPPGYVRIYQVGA